MNTPEHLKATSTSTHVNPGSQVADETYDFSDKELAYIDECFEEAERDRVEGKLIPAEEVFAELREKCSVAS